LCAAPLCAGIVGQNPPVSSLGDGLFWGEKGTLFSGDNLPGL